MTWFEDLTGFAESDGDSVRGKLAVEGDVMTSSANGREMRPGRLETPSLKELRRRVRDLPRQTGQLRISEVVDDVRRLHADRENAGALFQVASQFNLLEMTGPGVTPEYGVGIYEDDHTQGPACAIACGAGTIYRNYFAEVNGAIGQTAENQIDCLRELGEALGNRDGRLWTMRNGYALASEEGLREISEQLSAIEETERDRLRERLRIGLQWETEVTLSENRQSVSQAYCSALPVAYSMLPAELWADFAQLVLEAAYEATLCAALLNAEASGNSRLYLTLLGGGAFGNRADWIFSALFRAIQIYEDHDLEVAVVSYGGSNRRLQELIEGR